MNSPALQLRTAPPLLIGAGLLVWGWQCSMLPYAILMALLLESCQLISWRWEISDREFNTLSDFSGVVFFIAVVYIFSNEGARGIFVILSVLPFILFPLLITQKYSEQGKMKLSTLFVSLRKLDPDLSPESKSTIDVGLPYFIMCLVAASAGNQRTMWFFAGACLLFVIVLWSVRPARYSIVLWIALVTLAISLAYTGQLGLRRLQATLEASFLSIFDQYMWRYRDPNRNTTAIGSLGRLKVSDRIVLRLKTDEKLHAPLLVREASYNTFGHGIWSNQNSEFVIIDQNADSSWTLADGADARKRLTASTYMTDEKGVIPLPHGSTRIDNVAAIEIGKNPYGTVLMDIREGWVRFDVDYSGQIEQELPPNENDLAVLNFYREDFDKLARELELHSMPAAQVVDTVQRYFSEGFRYSLNQRQRYPKGKYLTKFLFENKTGHCEYFATATALLLRSAGVPSRYAVGYSVDEYSTLERQYIARSRHAHSWVLVYVEGGWKVLDTTPSIWAVDEAENASALVPLMDLWAWISYTWLQWQSEDLTEDDQNSDFLLWLLVPLIGLLAWRMYIKERVQRRRDVATIVSSDVCPGSDSVFYQLTDAIERAGLPRHPGETLSAWFERIANKVDPEHLKAVLSLHYRYRFDPAGLSFNDVKKMEDGVTTLLSSTQAWLMNPGN